MKPWLPATHAPAPTVYRNDDGSCLIDWNTPDGNMPDAPVLMSPELIVACVETINAANRETLDTLVPVVRESDKSRAEYTIYRHAASHATVLAAYGLTVRQSWENRGDDPFCPHTVYVVEVER